MYSCFKIKCICSRGGRLMSWVYLFLGGSQGWVETSITNSCPCSRAPGPHPQSRDSPAPLTHCRIEHTPSSQMQVGPEGPAQDEGLSCRCLKSSKRWDGGAPVTHSPACSNRKNLPFHHRHPLLLLRHLHGALLVTMATLWGDYLTEFPRHTSHIT